MCANSTVPFTESAIYIKGATVMPIVANTSRLHSNAPLLKEIKPPDQNTAVS